MSHISNAAFERIVQAMQPRADQWTPEEIERFTRERRRVQYDLYRARQDMLDAMTVACFTPEERMQINNTSIYDDFMSGLESIDLPTDTLHLSLFTTQKERPPRTVFVMDVSGNHLGRQIDLETFEVGSGLDAMEWPALPITVRP